MPTVPCKDCGYMVSPSADKCPNCGGRYPASHKILPEVVVYRIPTLVGLGLPIILTADDEIQGEIKQNEKIVIHLQPGKHVLVARLKMPGSAYGKIVLNIQPAKKYTIEMSLSMGFPKHQINFQIGEFEA
jgi:hypothetical protein